jgi:hypothetical protein
MRTRVLSFLFPTVLLLLATTAARAQPQLQSRPPESTAQKPSGDIPTAATDPRELANQVNNPAAPVTLLQFRNVLLPDVSGTNGATNVFQIQPVLPIGPFASLPLVQLMKITLPFNSLPQPLGVSGLGDLQVFDLVTIKESWGRWGFGPALIFPTASDRALGQGKWQAGPAVALIYTGVKNLTAGAVWQNPISYAGASDRSRVNSLIITPTLTYTLEKGWFAGLSDFNWTFDWTDGGASTILLGVQAGRVFNIGKQDVSVSLEVGGAATKPSTAPGPGWILGIEFTPVFKGHIR